MGRCRRKLFEASNYSTADVVDLRPQMRTGQLELLLRYVQKDYLVPKAVTAWRDDASAVRLGIPRVRWLAWA